MELQHAAVQRRTAWRTSRCLLACGFALSILLIPAILSPSLRRNGRGSLESTGNFRTRTGPLCAKTVLPSMAPGKRGGLARALAIIMPSSESHEDLKSILQERLGLQEDAAEDMICKSLKKMDWEAADDADMESPPTTPISQCGIKLRVGDPYQDSKGVLAALGSLGMNDEELKNCVTKFPVLLRKQSTSLMDIVSALRDIGMTDKQLIRIVQASPILAYDAERHVLPAIQKLRKKTKLNDRTMSSLIAMQPDLLTAVIDEMWSSSRTNFLLNDAYEYQLKKSANKAFNVNSLGDSLDDDDTL